MLSSQTIQREIGVSLHGLNDFDFIYKKGDNNNLTRYRFLFSDIRYQNTENTIKDKSAVFSSQSKTKGTENCQLKDEFRKTSNFGFA